MEKTTTLGLFRLLRHANVWVPLFQLDNPFRHENLFHWMSDVKCWSTDWVLEEESTVMCKRDHG